CVRPGFLRLYTVTVSFPLRSSVFFAAQPFRYSPERTGDVSSTCLVVSLATLFTASRTVSSARSRYSSSASITAEARSTIDVFLLMSVPPALLSASSAGDGTAHHQRL